MGAFFKPCRCLAAAMLALTMAAAMCGPAGAQQKPLEKYLDFDKWGRLVWVYYDNKAGTRVTVPAGKVDQRQIDELLRRRAAAGQGTGTGRAGGHGNTTHRTGSQSRHVGEPPTSHPGGTVGRTSQRTGSQNPFAHRGHR